MTRDGSFSLGHILFGSEPLNTQRPRSSSEPSTLKAAGVMSNTGIQTEGLIKASDVPATRERTNGPTNSEIYPNEDVSDKKNQDPLPERLALPLVQLWSVIEISPQFPHFLALLERIEKEKESDQ